MKRVGYFVARALAALKESPAMSIVTTLTIAAALVVLGVFAVGVVAVDGFTQNWGRVASVTAYIDDEVRVGDWTIVRDLVASLDGVAEATLVTPEQALEQFKERGEQARALVEGVTSQLLPASIEIRVTGDFSAVEQVHALAHRIAAVRGIHDVDYGREDHARFSALSRIVRFGGIAAALVVALATAFIVSNTIRLTVFARRSEIGILKLVGATNTFVRLPFVLEGAIWGVLGSGCAVLFLFACDASVARALGVRLFGPHLAYGLLATGVLLGVAGALLAVRRFLDVEPA